MKTSTELIPLNQSAWGICQAAWPIKNAAPFPLIWASLPNPYPSIWGFIWICSSAFRPAPSLAPLTRLYSPSIQLAGKGQRPSSAKTTCKAFCCTTCVAWLPFLLPILWLKDYCQQSFNGNWLQLHASRTRHIYNAPDHYVQCTALTNQPPNSLDSLVVVTLNIKLRMHVKNMKDQRQHEGWSAALLENPPSKLRSTAFSTPAPKPNMIH